MRQKYVHVLLKSVFEKYKFIKSAYSDQITNEIVIDNIQEKIKSSLEHLRSCLDYMAQDIYDKCILSISGRTDKPIYFPYGKTDNDLKSFYGRSPLSGLKNINIDLYNIIESVQPYKCGNNWLVNLCEKNNSMKHKGFVEQKTKKHVNIEDCISISGTTKVIIDNISLNGKKIEHLEFDHDELVPNEEINKVGLKVESYASYSLADKDIIELIENSHSNISKLEQLIYSILH